MIFRTKHAEPMQKILSVYAQGPGLIAALETYCQTVELNAIAKGEREAGNKVCVGLHSEPSRGVVCASCHDHELEAPIREQVEAEMRVEALAENDLAKRLAESAMRV